MESYWNCYFLTSERRRWQGLQTLFNYLKSSYDVMNWNFWQHKMTPTVLISVCATNLHLHSDHLFSEHRHRDCVRATKNYCMWIICYIHNTNQCKIPMSCSKSNMVYCGHIRKFIIRTTDEKHADWKLWGILSQLPLPLLLYLSCSH